ncbi:MAG TPA: TIR domain-containing protein, partial [Mycobacterium sp.]
MDYRMVRDVSSPQPPGGPDKTSTVVHIFQSYGWRDAVDVAQRLKDSLTQAGYEVWIDREHLRADDKHFSLALEQAITDSEMVVALLSPHSVRGIAGDEVRSSICYNELRLADELQRPIVPVRVSKFIGPPPFLIIKYRRVDWLDWNQPQAYRKGLHEITEAIKYALAHGTLFDPDIAFQATNFTPQLHAAVGTFTGREWLFDKVDAWLADRNPCFLLEGVTGSGKTALVAELVRRNPGGRVLAYHFCTPVQVTVDPVSFVRSIAGMLAA